MEQDHPNYPARAYPKVRTPTRGCLDRHAVPRRDDRNDKLPPPPPRATQRHVPHLRERRYNDDGDHDNTTLSIRPRRFCCSDDPDACGPGSSRSSPNNMRWRFASPMDGISCVPISIYVPPLMSRPVTERLFDELCGWIEVAAERPTLVVVGATSMASSTRPRPCGRAWTPEARGQERHGGSRHAVMAARAWGQCEWRRMRWRRALRGRGDGRPNAAAV